MLNIDAIWGPDVQQQNYRALLEAMSRPGKVQNIIRGDSPDAALAVLATLLDGEVTLSDHHQLLSKDSWPLLQSASASSEQADFILCDGKKTPNFEPKLGELASPELSATLVMKVDQLSEGSQTLCLSGPGIEDSTICKVSGLNAEWLFQRNSWVSSFPLGTDLLLVDNNSLIALPRTTKVEML